MRKVKVGRNEKCPCGSGKKYKYCCMIKEEAKLIIDSQAKKYFKAEKDMITLVMKYINDEENKEDFNVAIEEYFGGELSEINISDSEFNFFMAWYVKNYNFDNPFINRIIEKEENNASSELKELFQNLKKSNLFLYKVIDIKPNKITFKNLHKGSIIEVVDDILEQNVNIDDVIYTRVYKIGKLNKLFGGSMFIPGFMVDEILSEIEQQWNNSDKSVNYDDFIQLYSIKLIKNLNLDSPDDRIIYNDDNEFLQYSVVKYNILDRAKCNFILENDNLFLKNEDEINIVYQWIENNENKTSILGEITLSEEELKMETDSFERKEKLQRLLEEKLKGIIKFSDEDYFTIRQIQEETLNIEENIKSGDAIERLLLDNMKGEYSGNQIKNALILAKQHKSRLKRLKPESIASAIECIIISMNDMPKTQKEVADKYGVSSATVGKWAKEIKDKKL